MNVGMPFHHWLFLILRLLDQIKWELRALLILRCHSSLPLNDPVSDGTCHIGDPQKCQSPVGK